MLAAVLAALLLLAPLVTAAQEQPAPRVHVVTAGETLRSIAARYGVSVQDIVAANQRGGALSEIVLYVGQRLRVPVEQPPLMPTPPASRPTPTPAQSPQPAGGEQLRIITPTLGITVTSPLLVAGLTGDGDATLTARVLDASGFELGLEAVAVDAAGLDSQHPFSATVTFAVPTSSQPGRVQVYSTDARDGAIEHLTSVRVVLRGAGLDAAIVALKRALEAEDFAAIAPLLGEPWTLGFYRSEGMALTAGETVRQLRQNFLGPGDVFVDLSVDARRLLGDDLAFASDITHVVFSTGWGPDAADDALLLLAIDDEGQTRWTGMLYIYDGLRFYELP
jgi:LysM repeat protein